MKKMVRKRKGRRISAGSTSIPCPECGSGTRVRRTSLGERLRTSKRGRDFIIRERVCVSPARHRFTTEERSK